MDAMMQLVVGWILVGAFGFTVVITCFSLVGWVRFADKKQQGNLFTALIVEVVVGVGSNFAGAARFDPEPVEREVKDAGANDAILDILGDAIVAGESESEAAPSVTKAQAQNPIGRLRVEHDPALASTKKALDERVRQMPTGALSRESARALRPQFERVRVLPRPPSR